jgi:hypothetical protein
MFENAWMERSKFPYTAQTTARVIRHAVSIDERRAKFRQDLISEVKPLPHSHHAHKLRHLLAREDDHKKANIPEIVVPENGEEARKARRASRQETYGEEMRYRAPSSSPNRRHGAVEIPAHNGLLTDRVSIKSAVSGNSLRVPNLNIPGSDEEDKQDIQEVWFPGQHGDVGGGWKLNPLDPTPLSHIPLAWMVKEAQLAGLEFDSEKLKRFNCYEAPLYENPGFKESTVNGTVCQETNRDPFQETLSRTMDHGIAHDCLTYGGGLSFFSTLSWRLMEYMPFRRMDLQADGSWKPIRWPLPCGEVRDIPENAQIHICAIHRMQTDPGYRPGNLIIGGGGRGVKRAPEKYGIGEWEVCMHEGDPVRQTFVRKKVESSCLDDSHVVS